MASKPSSRDGTTSCPGLAAEQGKENDHIDEFTALIQPDKTQHDAKCASERPDTNADDESADGPPLPMAQVLILCFLGMIGPLGFFCIFPYINQMVQENGNLPAEDVGFYSGVIESLFSLTETAVMIFWGQAADRFGRRPVLIVSLIGMTAATGLFGFGKTLGQMILFRCLSGIFSGTTTVVRTMLAENSTSKTRPLVFGWFSFSNMLGLFIGPMIGGVFANPTSLGIFRGIRFFGYYPYALPTLVVAFFSAIGLVATICGVEETLDKTSNDDCDEEAASQKDRISIWRCLSSPGVYTVLSLNLFIMMLAFAYTAISSVFWFTPRNLGGFGFTSPQISLFMAMCGAAQACWLLLAFPFLQRRFGTNGVIRICGYAYPFFFLVSLLGGALMRIGTPQSVTAFWVIVPAGLAIGCGVSMSFEAINIAIVDISPSPKLLATLNSVASATISCLRAFSPALFTTLFALGIRTQLLGGLAIWVFLAVLSCGMSIIARYLPEPKKDSTSQKTDAIA